MGRLHATWGDYFYTYILADTDDIVAVLFDSIQQIPYSWLARDSSTTVSTDALTPTPSHWSRRRGFYIQQSVRMIRCTQICGCGCGFQVDIQYRKLAVVVLTMIPKTTVLPQPKWFHSRASRAKISLSNNPLRRQYLHVLVGYYLYHVSFAGASWDLR